MVSSKTFTFPAPIKVPAVEHFALYLGGRRAGPKQFTDEVLFSVRQRTTGHGRSFLATRGQVTALVPWLIGVAGRQPLVPGFGERVPDPWPVCSLIDRNGSQGPSAAHPDGMTWVNDGQFVLVDVRHHRPGNFQLRAVAHLDRGDIGEILDWLATYLVRGWPDVERDAGL